MGTPAKNRVVWRLALWALGLTMLAPLLAADDWPQMGGPERSGVSRETGLARSWAAGGPRVLWTVDLGQGFGGAAIRDGQVYVLDRVDGRQDVLRCLDLNTGRALWDLAFDAPGTLPYNGSRNVPTVDDRRVYSVGPFGQLRCVDRSTHKLLWSAHLVDDFKDLAVDVAAPAKDRAEALARTQLPEWGMTQSPLLHGEVVIVAPQTQKVGLAAYERQTGKLRWTSAYIGRNWYSHVSPTLVKLGGVEQVVMLAQPSDPEKSPATAPPAIVSAVDPATGRILWKTLTPRPFKIPIPEPVQIADDRLFITGGLGLGTLILEARHEDGKWSTRWVSASNTAASFIHNPILWKDHLYLTSSRDHGGKNVGLVCLDLQGKLKWATGTKMQFDFGGMLIADGMAYIMHGRKGVLYLMEISAQGFKELGEAALLEADGHQVWAPLALSDGKLVIRDQHQMKCVDVRGR